MAGDVTGKPRALHRLIAEVRGHERPSSARKGVDDVASLVVDAEAAFRQRRNPR